MKRPQFSLRTFLLVIALVAVYIVGHKNGFRKGYSKAAVERGDETLGAYHVSDLVLPLTDEENEVLSTPYYSGDE